MVYESNGHVTDDIICGPERSGRDANTLIEPTISKTAGDDI